MITPYLHVKMPKSSSSSNRLLICGICIPFRSRCLSIHCICLYYVITDEDLLDQLYVRSSSSFVSGFCGIDYTENLGQSMN